MKVITDTYVDHAHIMHISILITHQTTKEAKLFNLWVGQPDLPE